MKVYDAVVVGAGQNGLAAAVTLARAGRSVLVCELADIPGGAVATEELTLPGFRHDVFSSVYPAAAASPVWAAMPLHRHGLTWVHPPVAMAHPLPEGTAAVLYRDLDATTEALDALTPGDGLAWRQFAAPYLRAIGAVKATMLGSFPPLVGGARLLASLRLDRTLEFARVALMPAEALADDLFAGGAGRAFLYGSALHGDVPPDQAGSAVTATYLNLLGHAAGWPSPRGGADALPLALVGYLGELGGEVATGTRVDRVLVARGRAAGVVTSARDDQPGSGERIRADVVVCDTSPHGLLRIAGHALEEPYRSRLARYRYGLATFKLDWALSGPVPWTAAPARKAGTVHVGGTAADLLAANRQVVAGVLPGRPFLLFGQQSLADPTRAPEGRHTAWAYSRVPQGIDWAEEGERFAERVEAQVERFAPGFTDRILARHVLTPDTIQARNPNLPGGDVGTGTYQLDQLVFRPVPKLAPYRTPIGGLYIGSAAAFPGGAVHGIPGRAAARVALVESALRRWR